MTRDSATLPRDTDLPNCGATCRLGLATRGNTSLPPDAVLRAIDRGVNYLNWCGHEDGLQQAVRHLGARRNQVRVAVQLEARSAGEAARELDETCEALGTDYLDVVTYYYVEHPEEWQQIVGPGGAAETLEHAQRCGQVRLVGLTSHQRASAAMWAESGQLDLLMIRYNAAHRGAERDVFPVTRRRHLPVVAFTCTRWSALMRPTRDDPPDFRPPSAAECYQFALQSSDVAVALMAPDGAEQLDANLSLLDDWRPLSDHRYRELVTHGERVRRHAGGFP